MYSAWRTQFCGIRYNLNYYPEEYFDPDASYKIEGKIFNYTDYYNNKIKLPLIPACVADITDYHIIKSSQSTFFNTTTKVYYITHPRYLTYKGELTSLPVNEKCTFTFKSTIDPSISNIDCQFRILGHEFKVTSEILSSNTPVTNDEITSLKAENAKLKEENEKLKSGFITGTFGDINGDNVIDGRDATVLLTYYAYTSTGHSISLEDFVTFSAATTE